jgi:hypothetical protein
VTINITAVNDAPVLDNLGPRSSPRAEPRLRSYRLPLWPISIRLI